MDVRKEDDQRTGRDPKARADARQAETTSRRVAEQAAETSRRVAEQAAKVTAQTTEAVADIGRASADTVQQNMKSGLDIATQITERSLKAFASAIGLPSKEGEENGQQAARNVQTILNCGTVLAHGFQNISQEWASRTQDRVQKNLDGMTKLMRCRTPQDAFVVQSDMVRDGLEDFIQGSRRASELMMRVTDDAMGKIVAQQQESATQGRRFH